MARFNGDSHMNGRHPSGEMRNRRKKSNRKKQVFQALCLDKAEWYDYIMVPLLIIIAIFIVINFQAVLEFFLLLTIGIIDILMFLGVLLIILVACICYIRDGRDRRR